MNIWLGRPYGSYHHIYVNGREDEPRNCCRIVRTGSKTPTSLVRDRELPSGMGFRDIIVVENAGASAMS